MEELDRLVNEYKEHGGTDEDRKRIRDMTFIYVYGLPERRMGLTDEDASTILLDMCGAIEKAIDTFVPGELCFTGFIGRLLKLRIRALVRSKASEQQKEEAVLEIHSYWESAMDEQERQARAFDVFGTAESPETVLAVRRMRYIFNRNPHVRRRFFIYLCRMLPFMEMGMVADICSTLGYDLRQTCAIAEGLWKRSRSTFEMNEALRERRNSHWQKQIAVEMSIFDSRYLDDEDSAREGERTREFHKTRLEQSNLKMERERKSILPSEAVAKMLGLAVGTVSSACHYSRRMVDFCCGLIPLEEWRSVEKLGLEERDHLYFLSGFWDDAGMCVADVERQYSAKTFMPFAEFGLTSIGKDGNPRFKK